MELKENPQGVLLSSLTLANSLLLLQCPSHYQGQAIWCLQYIFVSPREKVHFGGRTRPRVPVSGYLAGRTHVKHPRLW